MSDFDFFHPIKSELELVEKQLYQYIDTDIPMLEQAGKHLIRAGGKRLRPAFALLAAKIYRSSLDDIIPMAVALELVHMATLVHDDVIDNSHIRRGFATVKDTWGNRVSIYAGNYLFARSLGVMSGYQRSDILEILSEASMRICEGEITQMINAYNVNQGFKEYYKRIERKTALLIAVSCQLGGILAQADNVEVKALQKYGYYLGMAFQITDDILDFIADEEILGKKTGSDVKQGIITMPVIYALRHDNRRAELARLLSSPHLCLTESETIIGIIKESEGIEYSYLVTEKFAGKAKNQLKYLPETEIKDIFFEIADFIAQREY